MVLKRKFIVILFIFFELGLYAQSDYEIVCDNSFKVSAIKFDNNEIIVNEQKIHCSGEDSFDESDREFILFNANLIRINEGSFRQLEALIEFVKNKRTK